MRVQFSGPVTLAGATYGKGQHDIPAEFAGDWFFRGLVDSGRAVVLRDDPLPAHEPKKRGRPAKTETGDFLEADVQA